jgi:hypothetical protein
VLQTQPDGSLRIYPADTGVKGTQRLVHPGADAAERYIRAWVRADMYEGDRKHYLDPATMVRHPRAAASRAGN